jgi:mannose-1-phosphate guanylyltransferase
MRREGATGTMIGARARIDATARVAQSILWDDVEVGAGAVVEDCIVADRVRIAPGARYRAEVITLAADGTTNS